MIKYRVVKHLDYNDEPYFKIEERTWWWPFWRENKYYARYFSFRGVAKPNEIVARLNDISK